MEKQRLGVSIGEKAVDVKRLGVSVGEKAIDVKLLEVIIGARLNVVDGTMRPHANDLRNVKKKEYHIVKKTTRYILRR